jgi:hypothetical protein
MNTRSRLLALILAMVGALLSVPAAVGAGGHHTSKATDHIHLLLLSNKPNGTTGGSPVASIGAIHAKGVDKVTGKTTDTFVFPKGNLLIKHKAKHHGGHFDKKACFGSFFETGTWTVVSGTGAYSAANGGGTYKVTAQLIQCGKPKASQLQINAVGTVNMTQGTP